MSTPFSVKFTWTDILLLVGSLVLVMLVGVYYGIIKKQRTNAELFLGGRSMSMVPVSFSMLATYFSAILVLGQPAEIYGYGTLFSTYLFNVVVFVPLIAFLFVPCFYKLQLVSVYEYLELRFDSSLVRWMASGTYIVQTVLATGVVMFAPSLAMETFLNFPGWGSILVMGVCGTVYTAIGGLRAVVWTDVFQLIIMFGGMVTILVKALVNVGGIESAFEIASQHGRVQFYDFRMSPFIRHTTLGLVIGSGFTTLFQYSTHQPQVQRYCSVKSLRHAIGAMLLNIPLILIIVGVSVLTGVALFANYATCDPYKSGQIDRIDEIVPYFVAHEMSDIPGMMGLFLACLLSASLSTVSSGLNSLAAVTWEDFMYKMQFFRRMPEEKQARVTKITALLYGCIITIFSFLSAYMGPVLTAIISVSGAVLGPLGGVFILGLFCPFANKWGSIVGMVISHLITQWICIGSLIYGQNHVPLPTSIEDCPLVNGTMPHDIVTDTPYLVTEEHDLDWPEKMYTFSYILYSVLGSSITIAVGIAVSLLTGYKSVGEEKEYLLHPIVVKLRKRCCGQAKVSYDIKTIQPLISVSSSGSSDTK